MEGVDAFSARGGGLASVDGGVYAINETLLEHARAGFSVKHPAMLGAQLADAFSKTYGGSAFVVNPPDVDEFSDLARVTGWKGVYRESRIHALNQKEIGIRYGASVAKKYEEMNLIICHIGGGISVTAHKKGKMVDSNDIAQGDGPMAPTRCGAIPVKDVVKACFSGKYTEGELYEKITKTGGLVDHLGTSDAREVRAMMEQGNTYAKLVYDAMIYQIGKTPVPWPRSSKGMWTGSFSLAVFPMTDIWWKSCRNDWIYCSHYRDGRRVRDGGSGGRSPPGADRSGGSKGIYRSAGMERI